MEEQLVLFLIIGGGVLFFGFLAMIIKWYKKIPQGKAIVRSGSGGIKVAFDKGIFIIPVLHRMETMDISVKRMEIERSGKDGLICKDNLRADIKVVFFIKVNKVPESVIDVAQNIGCERASDIELLVSLFEAKFSEGLKTVGKKFDFVDLYNAREEFRNEILNTIGRDLNGYILDDIAIDYLEQTGVELLSADNILDSEGIKKITELTARQKIMANQIRNEEEKRIKKQDVEAKEAVLELEKQQAEAEEKQKREIAIVTAREEAETAKIQEEERLKSEQARIKVDEELAIAEENKNRQVIVAAKNKEKTEAVESERVEKERELEINERERVVELARIEKEKALEEERRNIQDVIKERVIVEKAVVEEEEKIKDTRAKAEADREKTVAITNAEKDAEEALVKELKAAEAAREAAKYNAEQKLIEAEADMNASEKSASAKKTMADANAAEIAAAGLAEARIIEAKAEAKAKEGEAEASVIEAKAEAEAKGIEVRGEAQAETNKKIGLVEAQLKIDKGLAEAEVLEKTKLAEAKGIEANATAIEKQGMAEAKVMQEKSLIEAQRIKAEAESMKAMDGVGAEMERFRLELAKEKEIELAKIAIMKEVAAAQASVLSEALKSAKIDIVGGETMFFEKIVQSISNGKSVDKYIGNSEVLTDVKDNLLDSSNGENIIAKVKGFIQQFGLTSEDVRNLSVSALLMKLSGLAEDKNTKNLLAQALEKVNDAGIAEVTVKSLGLS
eukprot:TRINITY_DN20386_c0_g1_i1.p1 TRINITY_DN20386_c0_g1~~TRINITY_DN20386_c0_g1_i1.p1  ORF type:complete len:735 (+),score=12.15 TRINITY_DN20386_c0_g1_i1:369-2573(+)